MYQQEFKLPVKLTDEQRTELEKRNATIDIDVIVAKEQLDAAKGIYKEKTEGIAKEKKNNLQTLRQGYQMELVNASEYYNEDEATVDYFGEDGLLIHTRAMTIDERRQYKIRFNSRQIKED
ncbi:hypothetical protein [Spirosoma pollinicola]|uniref:Uncharacterized protein n=1 Tax=Spirosoma pollinicola TaxID=2057025 RepID=A0A2K8YTL9_9BACT|nr:hypothetical protein [Spirosoma pollinicola]AUD00976.1 hypothetical protein CWM47_03565 [Spirosoma pollinicola]